MRTKRHYNRRFKIKKGIPTIDQKIDVAVVEFRETVQTVAENVKDRLDTVIMAVKKFTARINNRRYSDKKAQKWCDKNLPKIFVFKTLSVKEKELLDFFITECQLKDALCKDFPIFSEKDRQFLEKYHKEIYDFMVNKYEVDGFKKIVSCESNFSNLTEHSSINLFEDGSKSKMNTFIYFKQN